MVMKTNGVVEGILLEELMKLLLSLATKWGEGVERFFNRGEEIKTFEYLSKKGQGPKLLGQFANGRVEDFIHAR
ncbi:hypothetical protein HAX54_013812 [Datura stramonium]|uniref:Uncharacterized protein n=1 Tax=Datura stramonium TaxID=4076 RepID=A0ABS8RZ88_DATST|nr:hypothetical protein [Datura stramonium]